MKKIITFGPYKCIVEPNQLDLELFDAPSESGDLIQFTKQEDGTLKITNGMNGGGDNIFEEIKDMVVFVADEPLTADNAKCFWLVTASTLVKNQIIHSTAALYTSGVFFNNENLANFFNEGRDWKASWNIFFCMELTREQYDIYCGNNQSKEE